MWNVFKHCSSISIVNFEQIIAGWGLNIHFWQKRSRCKPDFIEEKVSWQLYTYKKVIIICNYNHSSLTAWFWQYFDKKWMLYSKRSFLPKHANKQRENNKKWNNEEKLQANMTKRDTRGKAAIVPKISSCIWTAWLYIWTTKLTSSFFLKIVVEHDAHVTGISGQWFSCSNMMTDCLQWLHEYVWYWHDDMCSYIEFKHSEFNWIQFLYWIQT